MKKIPKVIYNSEELKYNEFATEFLFNTLKKIEKNNSGKINIALSGGTTPMPILEKLKHKKLIWERYNFFMVDERCVSIESDSSNFGTINKIFLNDLPSSKFSMVLNDDISFINGVNRYRSCIQNTVKNINSIPQFDLILLGMGDDGHIASLFPKTDGILEENEFVIINKVPQLNTERITLTYPVILNALEIIVMIKGKQKLNIINEIYSGLSKDYPMSRIVKQHPNLTFLTA